MQTTTPSSLNPKSDSIDLALEILQKDGRIKADFCGRSMYPTLRQGMDILVEKTRPEDISLADIIMYKSGRNLVAHRVIRLIERNGQRIFVTKGDNQAYMNAGFIDEQALVGVVRQAFSAEDPNKNILIDNKFIRWIYLATGRIMLFFKARKNAVPPRIKRFLKPLIDFFFIGLKKAAQTFYFFFARARR
ncbi:signal peptidase I [Candidatus Omnitrophota bacterium]